MKKILVLHTGGTISMLEDEKSGTVTTSNKNPLLDLEGDFSQQVKLIVEAPFHLPSGHITMKEMLLLKERIEHHIKTNQIDGVVITHGTDTLEETAYFLELTLDTSIPIVITGAMRPSNEIGSDGLYNYYSSLRTALHPDAHDKGVLVVFNDEIHSAINVTKTHTSNISTFQSPQYGPIGILTKKDVLFHHQPRRTRKMPIIGVNKRVELAKAYAGMDSTLFFALAETDMDGLVIEALGQGNLPPRTLPGIQKLIDKDIPVVLVSRCFNGVVEDVYNYEGGGVQLKHMGVIFTNGLNGQKARIKLMLALEISSSRKELEEWFTF